MERNIKNEDKQELSEDRTEFAIERTDLARERTFSAWARTGVTAMAAGLGISRLLRSVDNEWLASTLGIILVATGALIFAVGYYSYRQVLKKKNNTIIKHSLLMVSIVSGGLFLSAILGIWLLFQEF
ncbi:MAG: YidH family protein [Bacteroidia bacterium]